MNRNDLVPWVLPHPRPNRQRDHLTRVALDLAAILVATLPASQWAPCIRYLLEAIDALGQDRHVHDLDIQAAMVQISTIIEERTRERAW